MRWGKPPPLPLPFEQLTTDQVNYRLIKPSARERDPDAAFAQQLLRADVRDASGAPTVGPATVFVSHAWSYNFATLAATVLGRLAAEPGAERVYLWLGASLQVSRPPVRPRDSPAPALRARRA
jgi:hypothetical protein